LAEQGCDPHTMEQLDDCLAEGDRLFEKRQIGLSEEAEYGVINGRFHALILEAADAPLLQSCIDRTNIVPFVSPHLIVFDNIDERRAFDLLFRAHGVHHDIVNAIRKGDGSRAEFLFREHTHSQRESMFHRHESASAVEASGRSKVKKRSAKRTLERQPI
jgi:GntR family transcriptional regulator of vanillate catabolism